LILTACASTDNTNTNKDKDENPEQAADNNSTPEAPQDPRNVSDDLDPADYNGAKFRILYRNGCARGNWAAYDVHKIEIAAEEENGDVINDALYKRNKTVEERFNVNIVGIPYPEGAGAGADESKVAAYAKKCINSAADEFDLVVSWSTHIANIAAEGMFIDWNTIPNINTSKPWWISDAMDAFTVKGRTYLAMNDIIFSGVVGEAAFIMFNKNLLADFGLESPYKMVEENRWTIDVLDSIVKNCYIDVNGDTKRDVGDKYGFTSDAWGSAYAWMWAGSCHVTAKDSDDLPFYDLYSERNANLLEKVYNLFYNNAGSAICSNKSTIAFGNEGSKDQAYLFSLGNALFMLDRVGVLCTPEYRNAPFDFGIVPIPKYDTTQEKYLTMINEHASVMAVPKFCDKLEMTGKIVEALAAESHKQLVPAYYEVALKTKYSRDEESVRMLDLIFEGVVYDFGLLYAIPTFDIYQTLLCNAKDASTFASEVEKNRVKAEKKLQDILDLYDTIE
jgi:hypothetical protein